MAIDVGGPFAGAAAPRGTGRRVRGLDYDLRCVHERDGGPVQIEFCPRCGTKRPDELQWCRKCGLDFHKAERGQFPPGVRPPSGGWATDRVPPPAPARMPPSGWATDRVEQGAPYLGQLDVRPVSDRANMARWTRNALDIRCLGAAGGCLGMVVGGFVGLLILGALGWGFYGLFLLPLFVVAGLFVGMRVVIGRLAK